MPNTPVLITGCQRSGTTLTHLILDSHPDNRGVDEDIFDHREMNRYLHGHRFAPFVSFKLPGYAPLLHFISSVPNMKILWCIRDPVDVVASMISLDQQMSPDGISVPWVAHPSCAVREIRNTFWVLDDQVRENLRPHVMEFRQEIKNKPVNTWTRHDMIYTAALCWRVKNELPEIYRSRAVDYHVVQYERLVNEPDPETRKILDYTGLPWHKDVLDHHNLHEGVSVGNTDNERPIDQSSVGKGRKLLSEREVDLVFEICGGIASHWGYSNQNVTPDT